MGGPHNHILTNMERIEQSTVLTADEKDELSAYFIRHGDQLVAVEKIPASVSEDSFAKRMRLVLSAQDRQQGESPAQLRR